MKHSNGSFHECFYTLCWRPFTRLCGCFFLSAAHVYVQHVRTLCQVSKHCQSVRVGKQSIVAEAEQ